MSTRKRESVDSADSVCKHIQLDRGISTGSTAAEDDSMAAYPPGKGSVQVASQHLEMLIQSLDGVSRDRHRYSTVTVQ
jgi:hypothetical protein